MIAAVVPAAGRSVRMGRPKLLMDFEGKTLIHRVVTALREGGADRIIVVPPADAPESAAIAAEAAAAGAQVLLPESQPAEMRESVELGLAVLDADPRPASILLAPGDIPGLTADLVTHLLEIARDWPDRIVVPTQDGRRGHPIILPWTIALRIRELPDDAGVNLLVERHHGDVTEVPVSVPGTIDDLDTPEDLERWAAGSLDRYPRSLATMMVRVRLFALARERAGRPEVQVKLTTPATVGDLRGALQAGHPQLGPLCAGAMIAVDEEYASDETLISPASRIALIPPVSGGGAGVTAWHDRRKCAVPPGSHGLR
jgi:molybdenum cofactor cytidylyltransferase